MGLTTDEVREIADAFLEAANKLDQYLKDNDAKLSHGQYQLIYEHARTLLRVATVATTEAVGLVIEGLKDPGTKLKDVIAQANEKIKTAATVGLVINLAGAIASLGGGIIAKDPNSIVTALTNIANIIASKS